MTLEVTTRTELPVIGMGGITSGHDALDFLDAGATCIAVGTESFRDPLAGARVRRELRDLRGLRNSRNLRVRGVSAGTVAAR